MKKTCSNCHFWDSDPDSWVCCNGESEYCADYTSPEHTCPDWEEDKK